MNKPFLRAFFAIDLPPSTIKTVEEMIIELSQKHPQRFIRWTKPHNLHITLQFLGALKSEDLKNLVNNVRSAIEHLPAFDLQLLDFELFPTHYQPHIISINMDQKEKLAELAENIGHGMMATGYEPERRPFRGHLTIGRLDKIKKNFTLVDAQLPKIEKFPVKEVILYKSEPNQAGSKYTILEKIKFSNH